MYRTAWIFITLLSAFAFQNCGSGYANSNNIDSMSSRAPAPSPSNPMPTPGPTVSPNPSPSPAPAPAPAPAPTTPQSLLPNPTTLIQYCTTAEGYRVPGGTTVGGYFTNAKLYSTFSSGGSVEMITGARGRACVGIGRGDSLDYVTDAAFCQNDGRWTRFDIAAQRSIQINAPDVYGRFYPRSTYANVEATNSGGCLRFKDPATAAWKTVVCGPKGCMPAINSVKMSPRSQSDARLDAGQIQTVIVANTTGIAVPNFNVSRSISLTLLANTCDQAEFAPGASCSFSFTNSNTPLVIGFNNSGYFNVGYILLQGSDPNNVYLIDSYPMGLSSLRLNIEGVPY